MDQVLLDRLLCRYDDDHLSFSDWDRVGELLSRIEMLDDTGPDECLVADLERLLDQLDNNHSLIQFFL